jgi:hypothetical protein
VPLPNQSITLYFDHEYIYGVWMILTVNSNYFPNSRTEYFLCGMSWILKFQFNLGDSAREEECRPYTLHSSHPVKDRMPSRPAILVAIPGLHITGNLSYCVHRYSGDVVWEVAPSCWNYVPPLTWRYSVKCWNKTSRSCRLSWSMSLYPYFLYHPGRNNSRWTTLHTIL